MSNGKHTTSPTWRPNVIPHSLRVLDGVPILVPPVGAVLRIGSDPRSDLALDDRFVSRRHCEVLRREDHVLLRDGGSTNGTFVNGACVAECRLEVGHRIRVGATTLEVLGGSRKGELAARDCLIGESENFVETVSLVERGASSDAAVLLVGESGTGKELFARLAHEASSRASARFVAINCGAISGGLIESELFGHERGAFTGAEERRYGVFEEADGGTLFLDEIGELPLEQQPRLLRVLETRRVRRVGGSAEKPVNVRIVAATHKSLARSDRFRLDLYHRLAALEVHIPPLRARRADVPLLVQRFIADHADHGPAAVDAETIARLMAYDWPGNVRELRNLIQRYAVLGKRALETYLDQRFSENTHALGDALRPGVTADEAMRILMVTALAKHGSVRKAAQAINLAKSTFHDRARRLGITLYPED
jgi:transcriptional regulator with PAS, ATPase and Fis domain